ncbi:hypothetical protein [uncultured Kordia sp.]|uniref:hypothetical protein n=1 Tax=uncultured Kordia sp. TaxID=507699 RepID=UPI0026022579|nr:hypothetical protein [uncultured Kordia sp.]
MERHLAQGVTEYWLRLPSKYKEKLSQIRVWKTLRMATDENDVWVRGIEPSKLHSPEIRSIPFKKIYFQKNNALFLLGGNLPEERLKTSLLWSPINKALPVEIPSYNFNYFGVNETIDFKLILSSVEHESKALLVDFKILDTYIPKAPAIRLQSIKWTIVNKKAFLIGTPLLPIPGKSYWLHQHFLIPTGYDFEHPELSNFYHKNLQTTQEEYIVLQPNNTYYKITTEQLKPLTISGYRLSQ